MGEALGGILGEKLLAARGATAGEMARLMHVAVVCSDDPVRSVGELVLDGAGPFATLFGRSVDFEHLPCED